jgi:hypothetical protein
MFRVLVTNPGDPPEETGRDYNQRIPRGGMEWWIGKLKSDLAVDDFCLKEFFATEAAFLTSGLARELHKPITGGRSKLRPGGASVLPVWAHDQRPVSHPSARGTSTTPRPCQTPGLALAIQGSASHESHSRLEPRPPSPCAIDVKIGDVMHESKYV